MKISFDIEKLQDIVDMTASIMNVPTALIMKLSGDYIEVLTASKSDGNPYKQGDKEFFENSGLYCEHVIKTRKMLMIPNALKDKNWHENPDIELNMISYLGLPIILPNGDPFGTICVLDNKENHYSEQYIQLLTHLRDLVQYYFIALHNDVKALRMEVLKATIRTVMDLVNNTLNNMGYILIKLQSDKSLDTKDVELFEKIIQNCGKKLTMLSELEEIKINHAAFGDTIKFE